MSAPEDTRTPFEAFALDFLAARGATLEAKGTLDWEAELPSDLAKKWRRQSYRLVFDAERTTLPRGGAFAAPGSVAGLRLLEAARGGGGGARPPRRRPGCAEDRRAAACAARGLPHHADV